MVLFCQGQVEGGEGVEIILAGEVTLPRLQNEFNMKKSTPPILLITFSALIFYVENWGIVGSFINSLSPCFQAHGTSFPCYAIVDFWVMGIMSILFVIGWIWVVMILIKQRNKRSV